MKEDKPIGEDYWDELDRRIGEIDATTVTAEALLVLEKMEEGLAAFKDRIDALKDKVQKLEGDG